MEVSPEECREAKRQIESTLHKMRKAVKTLEGKRDPKRYQSQITLAKRRIRAFELAVCLLERELEEEHREGPGGNGGEKSGP